MAELKTKRTKASVTAFINGIDDEGRRKDARELVRMMKRATGEKPTMFGTSIVGFGSYHYRYASGREGDWCVTGFSPRKTSLTLYIMPGFAKYTALLKKLGKHKTAKSCLYIKKLEDVDAAVLEKLVSRSVADIRKMYP